MYGTACPDDSYCGRIAPKGTVIQVQANPENAWTQPVSGVPNSFIIKDMPASNQLFPMELLSITLVGLPYTLTANIQSTSSLNGNLFYAATERASPQELIPLTDNNTIESTPGNPYDTIHIYYVNPKATNTELVNATLTFTELSITSKFSVPAC